MNSGPAFVRRLTSLDASGYRAAMSSSAEITSPGNFTDTKKALFEFLSTPSIFLFMAIAFLCRAWQFGNPVIHIDEQFYLLTGNNLLHGGIPFVDIWDRKPIGLFAIYAAISLLGGDGVLQYQVIASCCAAATAMVIARIACRLTRPAGAVIAGAVYLIYLMVNGGDGGQAPVFYNFPVALAALFVIKSIERPSFDRNAIYLGCVAMAVLGLAIQIKYSAVFEGVYFGLYLVYIARRRGRNLASLSVIAALWCTIALLPTLAVMATYWRLGFIDQFLFANFGSIFLRSSTADLDITGRLTKIAIHLFPVAAVAIWGIFSRRSADDVHRFVFFWVAIAIAALLGFGTYHDHYALPLLVPFAVAGARIYGDFDKGLRVRDRRLSTGLVVMFVGVAAAAIIVTIERKNRGTGGAAYAAARLVGPAPAGCIFVFSGDPVLYHLTRSCLPTAYLFPTLLSERRDATTMGIDQMTELRRAMAAHPQFVFTRYPVPKEAQPEAWKHMQRVLSQDYQLVFSQRDGSTHRLGYALLKERPSSSVE